MGGWACWLALALAVVHARELDPAGCATRFDVQRDKIIRTEESRDMGARYLAELDVGSRAECLRLCCETDACDVFVFEEKSPGSCYLFKCGPPEDFRCKFTAHGNFSSGVLALSRRLAELQDQERLAHHEQELERLRNPTSTSSAAPVVPPMLLSSQLQEPPQPPPQEQPQPARPPQQKQQPPPVQPRHQPTLLPQQPQQPQQPPTPTRRCSRYQFECRRGGECIAVYNACDGVAQCADGSDEAPELGCPAPPATLQAPPTPAAPTTPAPLPPPLTPPPQPQLHLQVGADVHEDPITPNVQAVQAMQGNEGESGDEGVGAGGMWPRRLAQAQHRYTGAGGSGAGGAGGGGGGSTPHIFSHQGGLLQPAPFAPAWPHRPWPPEPSRNEVESMEGAGGAGGWGYARLEPWADERRAWPVPPRPDPELGAYMAAKTMPELPLYTGQAAAMRDAPKKGVQVRAPTPPPLAPPAPDLREELKPDLVDNTTTKKDSPPKRQGAILEEQLRSARRRGTIKSLVSAGPLGAARVGRGGGGGCVRARRAGRRRGGAGRGGGGARAARALGRRPRRPQRPPTRRRAAARARLPDDGVPGAGGDVPSARRPPPPARAPAAGPRRGLPGQRHVPLVPTNPFGVCRRPERRRGPRPRHYRDSAHLQLAPTGPHAAHSGHFDA